MTLKTHHLLDIYMQTIPEIANFLAYYNVRIYQRGPFRMVWVKTEQ